jgi:hypothetical protein
LEWLAAPGEPLLAESLTLTSDAREARLTEASDAIRDRMESEAAVLATLVLKQPPLDLLAYL